MGTAPPWQGKGRDASDAGKVAFLLTGIEDTSPQLCYEIMMAPVRTHR